jgi:hypothetical protein
VDTDELKARAAVVLALVGSAVFGYSFFAAIPGTVAEVKRNAPLVRQGGTPEWSNPFMARTRGPRGTAPAPPPLPEAGGELLAGCIGAILAAGVTVGILALWRQPWLCLVALPGFFFGPLAGESLVRALTGYPAGDSPGLWCGLGVVVGLIAGPVAVVGLVQGVRGRLEAIAGK